MAALAEHEEARRAQRLLSGDETRRAMRIATVEGVLASASDNLAGPYLSLYALALGASHAQIGLVNALPALLTNVLQLPAAIVTDRLRRRKLLSIVGGLGMRLSWLPIALIPFVVPPVHAVAVYLLLLTLRSAFNAAAVPAWTSLMADITPRETRGAYFSNRNIMCNLAALGATLLTGLIVHLFRVPLGYQVAFGLAAAFGVAAAYSFRGLPDPDRIHAPGPDRPPARKRARKEAMSVQGFAAILRREKSFTAYALTSALWNFGVTLPQPLFAVYFVETLKGSAGFWGVVTAATFVTTILGQRYWGSLTDRVGSRNVLVASGIVAALIPGLWFIAVRPEDILWINLASGLGWAGFNLAAFNLLLEVTPNANRTTYVAGYNALIGLAHFAGPVLGGVAAGFFGVKAVFFSSTVVRMVAWFLFARRVHTVYDQPFVWREFVRLPHGGVRGLAREALALPQRVGRRLRARRLERRLRQKVQERLLEMAAERAGEQQDASRDSMARSPGTRPGA